MKENLESTKKKLPYYDRKVNSRKEIFDILSTNFDRQKIKDFIIRKNKYLKENSVMSDDKFIALFGGTGKLNKKEIKQDNHLGLCYAYSGFEILKKTNFFKELIQTNFKEVGEGKREVRIPFCDPNCYRIKVNKNEIFDENGKDREYSFVPRDSKSKQEKKVKITSGSSLGIKILEVAFMKSYIVFNPKYSSEVRDVPSMNARGQFNLVGDFEIKDGHLRALESGNVGQFMQHLFGKDIIKYNNPDIETDIHYENLIEEFNTGFVKISLTSRDESDLFFDDPNIKILNRTGQAITKTNKNKDGTKFRIMSHHVYSIERFYKTQQGEKRVWIVNPWNTVEKIDMSVQKCIDIFKRQIIGFKIDKMFVNKNEES